MSDRLFDVSAESEETLAINDRRGRDGFRCRVDEIRGVEVEADHVSMLPPIIIITQPADLIDV